MQRLDDDPHIAHLALLAMGAGYYEALSALEQLVALGERAVPALLRALVLSEGLRGANTDHIKRALVDLGEPALARLIALAESNATARVRLVAIKLLPQFTDERVGAALLAAFQRPGQDKEIRRFAAEGLARQVDRRAVEAFRMALNDPDGEVRTMANWALSIMGDQARLDDDERME